VILKFPTMKHKVPTRTSVPFPEAGEPLDHFVEQKAAEARYVQAAANLLRAVLKGDRSPHANCEGGIRKRPKKKTQSHQREIARRKKAGG
jgi:hypothetical protein